MQFLYKYSTAANVKGLKGDNLSIIPLAFDLRKGHCESFTVANLHQ